MIEIEDVPDLARQTIEEHVLHGRMKKLSEEVSSELNKKAGVFVSIKKNENLRGCIGTIKPTQQNIVQEVQNNAISAAVKDPRFAEIQPEELDELSISVDIIGEQERVECLDELDNQKFGVIVKSGHQTGLLLPNLEGIDTPEEQIDIARRKAGLPRGSDYELYKFEVKRYKE